LLFIFLCSAANSGKIEKISRDHPFFAYFERESLLKIWRGMEGWEGDGKVQDIDGNLKDERAEQLIPEDCP
jgi:hypothetical protein